MLLLHLGEYHNTALIPGRISLRILKTDTHLKFALKSPKMIRLVKKKKIPYECLRNDLRSLQICFTIVRNA